VAQAPRLPRGNGSLGRVHALVLLALAPLEQDMIGDECWIGRFPPVPAEEFKTYDMPTLQRVN